MFNPWENPGFQYAAFRAKMSQTREAEVSPQKHKFKETYTRTFDSIRNPGVQSTFNSAKKPVTKSNSSRKPVAKCTFNSPRKPVAKCTFNSPRKPVAKCTFNSPRKPVAKCTFNTPRKPVAKRAVKSLEFSPRSTLKLDVYFENINGNICLTKVRPETQVRWKLLKKRYWPTKFHSVITSRKTIENGIYNMKNHKTFQITLTDRDAQPYLNGKYIDIPKKPQPKAQKKATPSQIVNIRNETTNNYFYNSGPSTSNCDRNDEYESDSDSQDESSDESDSGSQDEYSDSEEYPSYVHNESHFTNDVYYG